MTFVWYCSHCLANDCKMLADNKGYHRPTPKPDGRFYKECPKCNCKTPCLGNCDNHD